MSIWNLIEDSLNTLSGTPKRKSKKNSELSAADFIKRERKSVADGYRGVTGGLSSGFENFMNVVAAPSRLTNAAFPDFFKYIQDSPSRPQGLTGIPEWALRAGTKGVLGVADQAASDPAMAVDSEEEWVRPEDFLEYQSKFENVAGPRAQEMLKQGLQAEARAKGQAQGEYKADPRNELFTSAWLKGIPGIGQFFDQHGKTMAEQAQEAGFGTGAQVLSELGNPLNYALDPIYLASRGVPLVAKGVAKGAERVGEAARQRILPDIPFETSGITSGFDAEARAMGEGLAQSERVQRAKVLLNSPPGSMSRQAIIGGGAVPDLGDIQSPILRDILSDPSLASSSSKESQAVSRQVQGAEKASLESAASPSSEASQSHFQEIPKGAQEEVPKLDSQTLNDMLAKAVEESSPPPRKPMDAGSINSGLTRSRLPAPEVRPETNLNDYLGVTEQSLRESQSQRYIKENQVAPSQFERPTQERIQEAPQVTDGGPPRGLPREVPESPFGTDLVPPSGTDIGTGAARPGPASQVASMAPAGGRDIPLGPGGIDEALSRDFTDLESKRLIGPVNDKPLGANSGVTLHSNPVHKVFEPIEKLAQRVGDATLEKAVRKVSEIITDKPLDLTKPVYRAPVQHAIRLARRWVTASKGVPQQLQLAKETLQNMADAFAKDVIERGPKSFLGSGSGWHLDEAQRLALRQETEWGDAIANASRKLDGKDPMHSKLLSSLSSARTKEDVASIIGSQKWGEYENKILSRLKDQAPYAASLESNRAIPANVRKGYEDMHREHKFTTDSLVAETFRLNRDAFLKMDVETRLLAMNAVRRGGKSQAALDKFVSKNPKLNPYKTIVDDAAAEVRRMGLAGDEKLIDELVGPEAYSEHYGTHSPFLYQFHENGLRGDTVVSFLDNLEAGGYRISPEVRNFFVDKYATQGSGVGHITPEEMGRLRARKDLSPEVKTILGIIEDPVIVKTLGMVHTRRLEELMKIRRLAFSQDHLVSRPGETPEAFAERVKITPGMAHKTTDNQFLAKQWGPLYGRYVHPDLGDWMTTIAPGLGGKSVPFLDEALRKWVWLNTVGSAGTIWRQFLQNFATTDVKIGSVNTVKHLGSSLGEILSGEGASYQEARKTGLFSGTGIEDVKSRVRNLGSFPDYDLNKHWTDNLGVLGDALRAAGAKAEDLYALGDDLFKLINYKHLRELNFKPEAASKLARESVYSGRKDSRLLNLLSGRGVSKSIRGGIGMKDPRAVAEIASRAFNDPFIGIGDFNVTNLIRDGLGIRSGSNTPFTDISKMLRVGKWLGLTASLSTLAHHLGLPDYVADYQGLPGLVTSASAYASNGKVTANDESRARPMWMRNRTTSFIPPQVTQFLTGDGLGGHSDLSWLVPYSSIMSQAYDAETGSYRNSNLTRILHPLDILSGQAKDAPVSPLLKPLMEARTNQDAFTGQPLWNENDVADPTVRAKKAVQHILRNYWSPSLPGPAVILGLTDSRKQNEDIAEFIVNRFAENSGSQISPVIAGLFQSLSARNEAIDKIAGAMDYTQHFHDYKGRERFLTEAILGTLGIRVYPIKPGYGGEEQRQRELRSKIKGAVNAGNRASRDAYLKRHDDQEAKLIDQQTQDRVNTLVESSKKYEAKPDPAFLTGEYFRNYMKNRRSNSEG